jgi:NAD(P)-dependent dehydrogenase (short-subunit alcohol dehydrogenase family)
MPGFDGRAVVVTGASGAMGFAVAERLVHEGARVHAPVRGDDTTRLEALGVRVVQDVDLTEGKAVDAFYAGIPDLWASIHCAGGFAMGKIGDLKAGDLQAMWETNARSAFLCSRAAVAAIRRAGTNGRIVNVAAQQALDFRRGAGMVPYTMSKAAVAALSVALAEELAPEGIWVNAVAPSTMDTPANRAAMPKADFSRWPKLEEIAEVTVFLASPANRAARGGIVPVFGKS